MSRALEMCVYAIIAFAQVAAAVFLLARYTHSANPAVPVQGISIPPQVVSKQRAPAALSTSAENAVHSGAQSYHLAPASLVEIGT